MVTAAWSIPLGYRRSYTPARDIVANVKFKKADHDQTMAAKTLAARKVTYVYDHDKEPLVQLRAGLQNSVVIVAGAKSLSELDKKVWLEFFPAPPAAAAAAPAAPAQPATAVQPKTTEEEERQFQVFHDALSTPESLAKLERAVAESMAPAEQHGLIEKLAQDPTEGNQQEIVVLAKGDANRPQVVKVSDVLIGEADWLKKGLAERLDSPEVAERIFTWLRRRLALDAGARPHGHQPRQRGGGCRRRGPVRRDHSRRIDRQGRPPANRARSDAVDAGARGLPGPGAVDRAARLFDGHLGHVRGPGRALRSLRNAL